MQQKSIIIYIYLGLSNAMICNFVYSSSNKIQSGKEMIEIRFHHLFTDFRNLHLTYLSTMAKEDNYKKVGRL